MTPAESARHAGVHAKTLPAVRIVEDGPVRTIVEAAFRYRDSYLCLRYQLPRQGTEIEIEARVQWNEKDRMLKLAFPVAGTSFRYVGQVAFGVGDFPDNGDEAVAQKWVAVIADGARALTCLNEGCHGSDCRDGELRLTLLRSPAYAAHPIGDRDLVPQDRFTARIDQGERIFRFWLNAGRLPSGWSGWTARPSRTTRRPWRCPSTRRAPGSRRCRWRFSAIASRSSPRSSSPRTGKP